MDLMSQTLSLPDPSNEASEIVYRLDVRRKVDALPLETSKVRLDWALSNLMQL